MLDKEIMQLSIENLAQKQFDFLKEYGINILEKVIELLKGENYEEIKEMLAFSAEGDGYGQENYYINFSFNEYSLDIMGYVEELERRKKYLALDKTLKQK